LAKIAAIYMKIKEIDQLYGKHKNDTVYILGTGPSIRCFQNNFFDDKITIGLNQAFKLFNKLTYSITIHPYLIPNPPYNTQWLTKRKTNCKGWQNHVRLKNHKHFYLFDNNDTVNDFSLLLGQGSNRGLFVGRGIQTAAMHLASILGASWGVLCGVPLGAYGPGAGEHHGLDQHTEFHGISPEIVYKEYYYYSVKVRELLRKKYNTQFLTLTPFLGELYNQEDYIKLCTELNLPKLEVPKDVEYFKRRGHPVLDFI